MIYPSLKGARDLFKETNVVPVVKTIKMEKVFPIAIYQQFSNREDSFILESSDKNDSNIRYSIIGIKSHVIFENLGNKCTVIKKDKKGVKKATVEGNPLDALKGVLEKYKGMYLSYVPEFYGGAVGFLGYDMVRNVEKLSIGPPDNLKFPDCRFVITKELIVIDHSKKSINIIVNLFKDGIKESIDEDYANALISIGHMLKKLMASGNRAEDISRQDQDTEGCVYPEQNGIFYSNTMKSDFMEKVEKAKSYIHKGDIFQVVLSQRFYTPYIKHPFNIYKNLSQLNPSPYMFYLNFGDYVLLGSSPEMLVKLKKGVVETYPIAGTRPRGKTLNEDKDYEKELLSNEKENAEHIMLVDLARNDMGRVCRFGTVKVEQLKKIQRFSHVMHIVSKVTGKLQGDKDAFDVINSCLPAGTVSGAPKIRAMQVIDELEEEKRGPYAGAIGYFSFAGDMDTCITIRSVFIKGEKAYIQSGAGIVMDSVPEEEYEETVNKGKALMKSIFMKGEIEIDTDYR